MELQDALIISLSGYSVVFFGLLVTSLIIFSFSAIPKWWQSIKNRKTSNTESVSKVEYRKVEPEVLAAIATVIEVERRLRAGDSTRKYTFKERRKSSGLV